MRLSYLCSFLSEEGSCSAVKESSAASPSTAESSMRSIWSGSSCDLQVCSSGENNEGAEPRLIRREEVFSFLSQPRSPTRGKGQGDQERMAMGNDVESQSGGRHEARPEDDFIGSESDEVCLFSWKDIAVRRWVPTSFLTHPPPHPTPCFSLGTELQGTERLNSSPYEIGQPCCNAVRHRCSLMASPRNQVGHVLKVEVQLWNLAKCGIIVAKLVLNSTAEHSRRCDWLDSFWCIAIPASFIGRGLCLKAH